MGPPKWLPETLTGASLILLGEPILDLRLTPLMIVLCLTFRPLYVAYFDVGVNKSNEVISVALLH